jgi:hypothetical protein
MKKLQLVISIVAILLLVVCGVMTYLWRASANTLNNTKQNLENTSNTLTQKQSELVAIQQSLEKSKTDLADTTNKLKETEDILSKQGEELNTSKTNLSSAQDELSVAKTNLTDKSTQLTAALAQAAEANSQKIEAQSQLANYKEIVDGLGMSVNITAQAKLKDTSVNLVDNSNAKNPTLAQLEIFLKNDNSENHVYIEDIYDCSQFSEHLHNAAEAAGIRCFVVHIELINPLASTYQYFFGNDNKNINIKHALNAFMTTDYGLIYINDEGHDTLARIAVGHPYEAVDISYSGIQSSFLEHLRDYQWWDDWWNSNPDTWSLGWFLGVMTNIVKINIYM